MRRREFITLIGGAAAAWPLAARAQQQAMPVVGFLYSGSADAQALIVPGLRHGLAESGYVEGRNMTIEYRWAEGQFDRLPALAMDLVRRRVNVIAAIGTSAPGLAAKAATSAIPIVFQTGNDPVQAGLVASLNQPGGNVTGISRVAVALAPKRLELLRDLVPKATVVAFLINPSNPQANRQVMEMEEPARLLGLDLVVLKASTETQLDAAFAALVQQGAGALQIPNDPFFTAQRGKLHVLAARHAIPAMYTDRDDVESGGLMSYGASRWDSYRQVGVYVGRILNGEKASELPVAQPTRFEFVLNLKTAKALGLTVPPSMFARADEVIE
jgi:putative ABC transport system substrate-binding protein